MGRGNSGAYRCSALAAGECGTQGIRALAIHVVFVLKAGK